MNNLQIFWQLLRINLKKSLIYRINFLITLWGMGLWIGLYVVFFEVLFRHVDSVAGWNKGEMLIFLVFYYFIMAIGGIFYRESFEQFNEKIRYGQLDHLLTKPVSLQLLTFFDEIRFDHIIDLFIAVLVLFYAFWTTDVTLSGFDFILGLVLALFGNLLFYGLLLMMATILFFVDRMDGIGSFMWHMTQISRYPRQIYTGVAKIAFQFVFPLALLASIPAEWALGKGSLQELGYFLLISLIFFTMGHGVFHWGVKKYSSSN